MWYEEALRQIGFDKDLDLNIAVTPHTEDPERTFKDIRKMLLGFGKS